MMILSSIEMAATLIAETGITPRVTDAIPSASQKPRTKALSSFVSIRRTTGRFGQLTVIS